jgi:hypothetical protein
MKKRGQLCKTAPFFGATEMYMENIYFCLCCGMRVR